MKTLKFKTKAFFIALLMLAGIMPVAGQNVFNPDPKIVTVIGNSAMECIYQYTVDAPLKDNPGTKKKETKTTILQANGSMSKFWDWDSYMLDSIKFSCSAEELATEKIKKLQRVYLGAYSSFFPVVIKNYPNGEITNMDEIYPADYLYTERKNDRNWRIKEDTMTVCGYLCNKAITSFGGREWTVWYSPEIAISDGPWKLYGLPGLILKAQDATGTHTFGAIGIRKSDRPIYTTKNATQVTVERDVFIKNKIKSEKGPAYELPMSMVKRFEMMPSAGGDKTVVINGRRSPKGRKTEYCPLELE